MKLRSKSKHKQLNFDATGPINKRRPIPKINTMSPAHTENIFIKRLNLKTSRDFHLLKNELSRGNILVINVDSLIKIAKGPAKNKAPLRSQLRMIQNYCLEIGGEMAKLGEDTIVISPNNQFSFMKN